MIRVKPSESGFYQKLQFLSKKIDKKCHFLIKIDDFGGFWAQTPLERDQEILKRMPISRHSFKYILRNPLRGVKTRVFGQKPLFLVKNGVFWSKIQVPRGYLQGTSQGSGYYSHLPWGVSWGYPMEVKKGYFTPFWLDLDRPCQGLSKPCLSGFPMPGNTPSGGSKTLKRGYFDPKTLENRVF